MAACSLGGASNVKFCKLDFKRTTSGHIHPWCVMRHKPLQFSSLVQSRRSAHPLIVSCGPPSEIQNASLEENVLEEKKSPVMKSQIIPNSFEVESLLSVICDTTSIAEFELKLGGFQLYVSRDLSQKSIPSPLPSSPLVSTNTTIETSDLNGSASTASLAISKPIPSLGQNQTLLDKAADEGLVILQSPRVGYFRRSRTIKGKRAPPSCKEKQIVKEGQVLCYIEQFGGEIPIESDVSGEIIKILREDGEPVGYGDALISILPSFPGIKKLH